MIIWIENRRPYCAPNTTKVNPKESRQVSALDILGLGSEACMNLPSTSSGCRNR